MAKLILLSADVWEMTTDDGEVLRGISVYALNHHRERTNKSIGQKPVKMNLDSSLWRELKELELPIICDAEYDLKPIAGGKAGITIVNVTPVKELDLFSD